MKIQILKESELPLLLHYAIVENWDIEEAHTFALLKTNPNDFFIAYEEKKLIGFIVALRESERFGFISSLLVLEEFRGLRFGKELFEFALKHLKGCQVALDSVVGKEKFYEAYGFTSYFDVTHYKFEVGSVTLPQNGFLIKSEIDKELISQSNYLNILLQDQDVLFRSVISKKVNAYAFAFKYKNGYKITIDSEDINTSVTLFFSIAEEVKKGSYIYLQVTKLSPLLEALVEALKMSEDTKSIRMYNKILEK